MTNVMGNTSRGTFLQENTTVIKYRGVKHGTDDQEVVAAVSGAAPIIGIATESADSTADNPVDVVMLGVAKMTILAASTKGDAITGTTLGKGATNTTQNIYCVGWLLETTTVANQVAKVMVSPFLYPTVT